MTDLKNRHGCLTAWLVLMIVINSASALISLLLNAILQTPDPTALEAIAPPVFLGC